MAGHAEEINLFKSLTGADEATATNYLESMDWNVQEAFEMFFAVEGQGAAAAPGGIAEIGDDHVDPGIMAPVDVTSAMCEGDSGAASGLRW